MATLVTTIRHTTSIPDAQPPAAKVRLAGRGSNNGVTDGSREISVTRQSLLSSIGPELVAARWQQWRYYFTDIHPTGIGPQRQPGLFSANAPMAYPKIYNIEMDPHEDLDESPSSRNYGTSLVRDADFSSRWLAFHCR